MNKFIFILFFAIGLGTAAADAIVKDKKVKESKPKYTMIEIMDFDGQQVLLEERTEKKNRKKVYPGFIYRRLQIPTPFCSHDWDRFCESPLY